MNKFDMQQAVTKSDLPCAARMIMMVLILWAYDSGEVPRFAEELPAATGIPRSTMFRALALLREEGWVSERGLAVRLPSQSGTSRSGTVVPERDLEPDGEVPERDSASPGAGLVPISTSSTSVDVRTTHNKGAQLVETATKSDSTTRVDNSTTNGVDPSSMTGTQVAQRNSIPDWAQRSISDLNPDITVDGQVEWDNEWHHLTVDLHHEESVSVHDSLSAYLNYCRNKTLIPIPSRFEQWYLKDQRDYSASVAAQRPVEYNPNDDFRITYRRDWDADLGITS